MQNNVTEIVQRYRQALRYLWNSCIWVDVGLRNMDSVESWRELKLPLYRALISNSLDLSCDTLFGKGFQIVPNSLFRDGFPEMYINSRLPGGPDGGIWNSLRGPIKSDEVTLTLLDLFDWTPFGYIDLRYFVVLVEVFRERPDIEGHHALVDVTYADVLLAKDTVSE